MSDRIKLIWDFRGMAAKGTALHHRIHLEEFAIKEGIRNHKTGVENINDMYSIAYICVEEDQMPIVRDALRPHRGEVDE
ncbi:hypothetical protein [Aureibacter tunicatorum]|uniref:Uncharacterized protein n=1 Tax=Aureibacter tunicatorum TaxID=866807 RepID=A0AAE4BUM3_9BACT|nr:hypothetical protein [Aureibacter tunicatorum]MDR6241225.1 hypothetical protein [Aureibacter tunicatorum]BDD03486.1 hypothetical protein AUTU_09690 [Aureibacter tunicatorum]